MAKLKLETLFSSNGKQFRKGILRPTKLIGTFGKEFTALQDLQSCQFLWMLLCRISRILVPWVVTFFCFPSHEGYFSWRYKKLCSKISRPWEQKLMQLLSNPFWGTSSKERGDQKWRDRHALATVHYRVISLMSSWKEILFACAHTKNLGKNLQAHYLNRITPNFNWPSYFKKEFGILGRYSSASYKTSREQIVDK